MCFKVLTKMFSFAQHARRLNSNAEAANASRAQHTATASLTVTTVPTSSTVVSTFSSNINNASCYRRCIRKLLKTCLSIFSFFFFVDTVEKIITRLCAYACTSVHARVDACVSHVCRSNFACGRGFRRKVSAVERF